MAEARNQTLVHREIVCNIGTHPLPLRSRSCSDASPDARRANRPRRCRTGPAAGSLSAVAPRLFLARSMSTSVRSLGPTSPEVFDRHQIRAVAGIASVKNSRAVGRYPKSNNRDTLRRLLELPKQLLLASRGIEQIHRRI